VLAILQGKSDPEVKRKTIGGGFIDVFRDFAITLKNKHGIKPKFLVQVTYLAPPVSICGLYLIARLQFSKQIVYLFRTICLPVQQPRYKAGLRGCLVWMSHNPDWINRLLPNWRCIESFIQHSRPLEHIDHQSV